eukprot:52778_1
MSSNRRHSEWLNECRRKLIEMETKNIRQRALSWSEIVNQETSKINAMLNINLNNFNNNNNNDYIYSVPNPLKYLTFLSEWNGIKTRNTSTEPTSYIEFEAKAKNWLNGRRAPNYGNTLFPDMIKSSYNYSNKLSILIFGNVPINKLSTTPNGDSLQNLYHKTLLFAYLHKLCSERIAVHQSWKKTNLLCENSVKNMHSNTAKLLQQYAIHDYTKNDLNSFPGNLQRSSAFFNEQHNAYLMRLSQAYNAYNNQSSHNNNKRNMNDMNNIIGGNMNNMIHSNNMRNDLNVNYVAIKSSEYANIMERLSALEQKHNDQATQISTLTTKCHALQQQIEATNAPSTIASIPSTSGRVHQCIDKLSSNENDPEYYNDQSYNSMDCSIQTSTTNTNNAMINKLVMHKSHSPSINSHHSQHDPNTQVQVQVQYNMQSQPMPFQASRSLPPQLNLPPFHPQSHNIQISVVNIYRKTTIQYHQLLSNK